MHALCPRSIVLLVFIASLTHAAPEQTASVLDATGGQSGGGALVQVSAVGQPGGVSVSAGGDLINYAGFLGTFSMQPTLDTDQDGLEDELDPDNDDDGLLDGAEIAGSGFSPTTATDPNDADSDGDLASDGDEAVAGTNPQDPNKLLRITSLSGEANPSLTWQARHGRTYRIYRSDDLLLGLPGTLLQTLTVNDPTAVAPWYEAEGSYDHMGGGSATQRTYYIEVQE